MFLEEENKKKDTKIVELEDLEQYSRLENVIISSLTVKTSYAETVSSTL